MVEPDPNDPRFRSLEDFVLDYFVQQGAKVRRTGQEYDSTLGRWSADFLVGMHQHLFYADAKLRNRPYRNFLIEDAPIRKAWFLPIPTLFVLVAEEPLEIMGCITGEDAWFCKLGDEPRTDHNGTGTGDPWWPIPATHLQPLPEGSLEDIVLAASDRAGRTTITLAEFERERDFFRGFD